VYIYEFDRAPPVPQGMFGAFDVTLAGAYHGAEMVYAFDTLGAQPTWAVTEDDRRVARQMSGYWANFIKTGNPNGAGLPEWPLYDPAQGPGRMRIGLRTGAETDPDYARYLAIDAAHDRIDPPLPVAPRR
jgi:para-nitrobenzyl esterase